MPVPLLLEASWISETFAQSHYLAPFCVLLLCGVGLPVPEEVSLIGAGILVARGQADFATICIVCASAILIGDSAPYWLGRKLGPRALRVHWIARVLHPERFAILERRFAEHGNWAVFTFRFLPGLRLPGYFMTGMLGMSYGRFLALDALGVLLSVPISIWLGELFVDSIGVLEQRFEDLHLILAFGLFVILSVALLGARARQRSRQAAALRQKEAEAAEAVAARPDGEPSLGVPEPASLTDPLAAPRAPHSARSGSESPS